MPLGNATELLFSSVSLTLLQTEEAGSHGRGFSPAESEPASLSSVGHIAVACALLFDHYHCPNCSYTCSNRSYYCSDYCTTRGVSTTGRACTSC